jgi:hypothetical protein
MNRRDMLAMLVLSAGGATAAAKGKINKNHLVGDKSENGQLRSTINEADGTVTLDTSRTRTGPSPISHRRVLDFHGKD